MKVITPETEARWKSAVHGGDARPTVRATIESGRVRSTPYNTNAAPGGDYDRVRNRKGRFRNINFGATQVREVRNLRRIEWGRSVDQDITECTLTILNSDLTPIGDHTSTNGDDFELPGLFTYNRGEEAISSDRWGYTEETGWRGQMVPDRLVRTYEGYGCDPEVAPGNDPNLYQSGTWLIDTAKYDSNGDIVLQMRDLARLFVDHIAFKPIVPHDDYPLHWSKIQSVMLPRRDVNGGEWKQPGGACTSSNMKYVGHDVDPDGGIPYVSPTGRVLGHAARHGYSNNDDNYWMSTGQTSYDDKVYWEIRFNKVQREVGAVRMRTMLGPYRVYISVQNSSGKWLGRQEIPYDVTTGDIDLNADIPYVKAVTAERTAAFDVVFPKVYRDVRRIRLTFTRLRRPLGLGLVTKYNWRASLRNFVVYRATRRGNIGFGQGEVLTPVGNYADYSDIIKWVGAWAGFWWPDRNENFLVRETGGEKVYYPYPSPDHVIPRGRIWGSFQKTGTSGLADLTPDLFDKQPLLDVINYVREVTGFSFWIDESGGIVWRMPNLFYAGNYLSPHHNADHRKPMRTDEYITVDENETLLSYSTTLSSRNLRERVFVANSTGKFGIAVKGFNPYPTGLMRVAGWTDQHWASQRECRVAADMIVARQMFDYRRSQMTIPGNPAIQIDDQIRIFERVTNETYYHYVLGISNTLDMDEGTWNYTLETHWLGPDLDEAFVVDVDKLDDVTKSYLNTIGAVE